MIEIKVKGEPLPIQFGIRAFQTLSEQYGTTIGEIITSVSEKAGSGESFATAIKGVNMIVSIATIALNEGARRAGLETRYVEDDIVDMIDDEPQLLSEFAQLLGRAVEAKTEGFTTGQSSPKNRRPPNPKR